MQKRLELLSEVFETEIGEKDLPRQLIDFEMWDSITGLGLMAKADEDLGITLTPEQLENAKTIEDLLNLLGS